MVKETTMMGRECGAQLTVLWTLAFTLNERGHFWWKPNKGCHGYKFKKTTSAATLRTFWREQKWKQVKHIMGY